MQSSIEGSWIQSSDTDIFLECPDLLRFNRTNEILVVNDCYGTGKKFLVAKGNYGMIPDTLIFYDMNFTSNYRSFLGKDQLRYILKIEGDKLRLVSLNGGSEILFERY